MEAEPRTIAVCFWNIWGHRYPEEIHKHLQDLSTKTDVICLTEVTRSNTGWSVPAPVYTSDRNGEAPSHLDGYSQLQDVLHRTHSSEYCTPQRTTWTCVKTKDTYHNVGFGSALFYAKKLRMEAHGSEIICKGESDISPRVLQWIMFTKSGGRFLVAHLHGVWIRDNTKGDHPVRRQQAHEVRAHLKRIAAQHKVKNVIFGGDLNLAPDTEALQLLRGKEGGPMHFRNLNEEHGITSTRTPAYRDYESAKTLQADYVLVTKGIKVRGYEANTAILGSDHAPLLVRFT